MADGKRLSTWLVVKTRQGVSVLSGNVGLPGLCLGAAGTLATRAGGGVLPSCDGK